MSHPSSKPHVSYTVAALSGAMAAFELAASMMASESERCSSVLKNTLSIPMTFAEYMDERMMKRSDEPLWIDDFVVDRGGPDYFCHDTGFRWVMPLTIYLLSVTFLYQRFRGNRTQDIIIASSAFIGLLIGGVAGYNFLDILGGFVPAAVLFGLITMPCHIEENWRQKEGTLHFN